MHSIKQERAVRSTMSVVELERKGHVIIAHWNGPLTNISSQIKQALQQANQLKGYLNCSAWLFDFTKCPNFYMDSESWLFSELIPQIVGAGYDQIAIVRNRNEYIQEKNRVTQIKDYIVGYFSKQEHALIWLEEGIY